MDLKDRGEEACAQTRAKRKRKKKNVGYIAPRKLNQTQRKDKLDGLTQLHPTLHSFARGNQTSCRQLGHTTNQVSLTPSETTKARIH
jgi:hypothetical protein